MQASFDIPETLVLTFDLYSKSVRKRTPQYGKATTPKGTRNGPPRYGKANGPSRARYGKATSLPKALNERFRRGGAHGHQLGRFHVQIDLNFTSNSTSILRPIRPQFYVQFEANGTTFFCRRYGAGGT